MEAPATRTQPLVGGGAHLPELGSGLNAPTAPIAPPGADAVVSTTQCAQGVSLTLKSDCDASVTEAAAAKQDVTVPTSAVQGLVAHSGGDPEISMMVRALFEMRVLHSCREGSVCNSSIFEIAGCYRGAHRRRYV